MTTRTTCPKCGHKPRDPKRLLAPDPSVLAFLRAACDKDDGAVTSASDIQRAMAGFCESNPQHSPCSTRVLGLSLRRVGLIPTRMGGMRAWEGVRLRMVYPTATPIEHAPGCKKAPPMSAAAKAKQAREDAACVMDRWYSEAVEQVRGPKAEASTPAADIYASLCAYLVKHRSPPIGSREMATFLSARGLYPVRLTGGVRGWYGIKPKPVDTPTPT